MGIFTPLTVLIRWLVAVLGIFIAYNPYGVSYYAWVERGTGPLSLRVLAGVALLTLFVVYARATLRSLGPIGMGLAFSLFGAAAWLLAQWRVVDLGVIEQRFAVSQAITASVLGVGLSWSGIRYKISGQYDSEDVGTGL